jgi:LCP family protein required for cell wall assembly
MGKQKRKGRSAGVKVLSVVLAVLLVLVIAALIYVQSKMNLINRPEPIAALPPEEEFFEADENGEGHQEIDPGTIQWPEHQEASRAQDVINILLIGQDRRPGESRARSDSMMIATINCRHMTVQVTSLMRDMYVQIPGYSDNRINAAYAFGGMELLNRTIEKNLLISIDGNIEVDFDGFVQVIDQLGGIQVRLNRQEAEHLRGQGFSDLSEGMTEMDGRLALAYSRIRRVGHADYERTERQRRVVTAVFQKVRGLGFSEIGQMISLMFPLVTTDLTNQELLTLAFHVYRMDADTLGTHRIPADGAFQHARIRGMSVLVPNLEKNRSILRGIVFGE